MEHNIAQTREEPIKITQAIREHADSLNGKDLSSLCLHKRTSVMNTSQGFYRFRIGTINATAILDTEQLAPLAEWTPVG